ncbi:MAG: InlB B-repeat-containing protein [Clostridia bacterium]|nr:InlB B-repeat-containing protein [Clostridia bacterium]
MTKFVFLNKQDGENDPDIVKVSLFYPMPAITLPTRTGYDFQGYYSAKNGGGTKYYNADGSSAHVADFNTGEVYAHWILHHYSITYTLGGGTVSPSNANPTSYHILSNSITLTNPTRTGYTFKGWSGTGLTGDTNLSVTIPTGSYGDRSYTANWTPITYSITYDLAGGSVSTANPDNYTIETPSFTLNNPTKQDYVFDGWTGSNGSTPQTSVTVATGTYGDLNYLAHWIKIAQDDTYVLDYGLPTELNVLDNDAPGASLSSVASSTGFTASVSNGKILFTPTAALNAAVTFDYTLTYGGASYTASVTVIPANNVYYEETFFTFGQDSATFDYANNTAASWQSDGTALSRFQEGARPGAETSPVYGFDNAYTSNGMTYSLGTAQYAEVSANAKGGATASFTFTGTGFDFYSVTDHESGLTFVEIYRQTAGGSWENIESTLVNAYFGYKYGQLYLKNDQITLDNTGTPIYLAPEGQTDGTFFVDGMTRGWLTPTYKDGSGTLVTTQTEVPAYASGWVAGESDADGIYQVPVISRTGLDYGTYKVVVEPRWSARQNLTGGSSYKFYVDAVRVYDPIDPSTIISGSAAYNAYVAQGEYGATYQEVRDLLINSFGDTQGHGTPGVAFLEPGKGDALQDYKSIGPKNEVYLNPGQAIAFSLTTSAQTTPAKLSLGLRQVEGGSGAQVTVYSKDSTGVQVNVSGSTELYRDIGNAVAWQATTGAACTTSAPIIIANTGASGTVISITKLKWSYNTEVTPVSRMLSFSISPRDLVTASALLRQAAADAVAPDASGVRLHWNTKMISRSGVATLSITAPANFEKAYVNGAEIAGYTENADGTRTWRYDFSSYSVGKHAFDVRLKDANGYTTKAIAAEQVEVVATSNGQGTLTLQALLQRIFNSFLQALRALFRR